MKKNMIAIAIAVSSSVFLASPAMAAIDLTAATTALTADGTAAITTVGTALLGLAGIAVVFKWAKAAFFG